MHCVKTHNSSNQNDIRRANLLASRRVKSQATVPSSCVLFLRNWIPVGIHLWIPLGILLGSLQRPKPDSCRRPAGPSESIAPRIGLQKPQFSRWFCKVGPLGSSKAALGSTLGHNFCRSASNIDFRRTSLAIVKVLGCQGDHFGTDFGPKWHHEQVIFALYRPSLATSSAERL